MMQQLDESIERSVQKAISHNQQSRNKENQIDKISKSLEGTDMTLQKLLARKADTDEITWLKANMAERGQLTTIAESVSKLKRLVQHLIVILNEVLHLSVSKPSDPR